MGMPLYFSETLQKVREIIRTLDISLLGLEVFHSFS